MARTFQVTVDARDPRALSTFWAEALGSVVPSPPGADLGPDGDVFEAWDRFLEQIGTPESERDSASALEDPTGVGPRLFFQKVPEAKTAKNRMHLDLRAAVGLEGAERMAALEAECARLEALGAQRLQRFEPDPPLAGGFIVMADPEGNEFCLD